jgi:hypothetical protein
MSKPVKFSIKHRERDIISYIKKTSDSLVSDDIEGIIEGEFNKKLRNSLLKVNNSDELWTWIMMNFDCG